MEENYHPLTSAEESLYDKGYDDCMSNMTIYINNCISFALQLGRESAMSQIFSNKEVDIKKVENYLRTSECFMHMPEECINHFIDALIAMMK